MALEERKILASVDIQPTSNTVNVRWDNQILRDGVVVSTTPHRTAYSVDQKDAFLAEVEGADKYIAALGW